MKRTSLCSLVCAVGLSIATVSGCGSHSTASDNTSSIPSTAPNNGTGSQTSNAAGSQNPTPHRSTEHGTGSENSSHNNTTTGSTTSVTPSNPLLTLEQIQVADHQVVFILTHGDMQNTYGNPHISADNKHFIVTLKNVEQGHYPLNKTKSIQSNWATSYQITRNGHDLTLSFTLKPGVSHFTPMIGGGDQIAFTFQ
ncbi:hypothetical protein [Alicyclobacillus fastidiosus]|uniref:Lipoprotein n=1 Tax=Alicyclobacillus fastidiosus TaxID=392011 RepID=A0ABV5AJL1_9BACL|nr:hypothetical protein [Alicyclobacillus fastidiosus]WEH11612.1 hypothetical protein PYS47_10585 [Alicyclobacillus fastidiosus]